LSKKVAMEDHPGPRKIADLSEERVLSRDVVKTCQLDEVFDVHVTVNSEKSL